MTSECRSWIWKFRSSHIVVFCERSILKNFANSQDTTAMEPFFSKIPDPGLPRYLKKDYVAGDFLWILSNFSDSNSVKHLEKVASKTSKWVGQEFSKGINLIIQIKVFYVWNINPKVHQRFLLKIIKIRFEKIMK